MTFVIIYPYHIYMRTIIEIPEEDIKKLDVLCHTFRISRAEAIRRAVNQYLVENRPDMEDAFGIWKKRKIDSLRYEKGIRKEWD